MTTSSFTHSDGNYTHDVLVTGPESCKPVILLHEADGFGRPAFTMLIDTLTDAGFRVYAPRFFEMSKIPSAPAALAGMLRFCVSREFHVLATRGNSPAAAWVRSLAQHLGGDDGRVGVIGMCLTGGLALGAAAEERVAAAVVAQPALPWANGPWPLGSLSRRRSLGLSVDESAAVESGDTPILALRFDIDTMSPLERITAIDELASGCALWVRDDDRPVAAHATLTAAFRDESEPAQRASRTAIDDVVTFLNTNL